MQAEGKAGHVSLSLWKKGDCSSQTLSGSHLTLGSAQQRHLTPGKPQPTQGVGYGGDREAHQAGLGLGHESL